MTPVLSERPPPAPPIMVAMQQGRCLAKDLEDSKDHCSGGSHYSDSPVPQGSARHGICILHWSNQTMQKKKRNIPGIQLYTRESCSAYALSNAEGALISPKWTAKGIYWECPSDCENYKFSPQECPECHLDRNWTDILPVGNTNMKMRLPFRLYPTLKKLLELHFEVKINLP